MKAIVKIGNGAGQVDLIDIDEPVCGEDEVKIEVKACAICATDLHIMEGSYPWETSLVLGHEFSGVIREVGKEVKSFRVGDRVASCMNGGFAEFAVKKEDDWVFKIPDHISFEEAALLEPLCSAANSVINSSEILPQDIVLIEGPGAIGIFAMQVAKLSGATVVITGIEKDKGRLEIAKDLGADYAIDVQNTDLKKFIYELTMGKGVDTVIECTGSQAGLDTGIELLRTRGQLTQVGIFSKKPQLDMGRIVYHSQRVVGSIAFDRKIWERCIKMLEEGKINMQKMITRNFPLDDWRKGFETTKNQEGLRVLLIP